MEDLLYYILFTGIGLSLFYLFYKWIWSSEKQFKISRLLLFIMPVLAAIVPLIPWQELMKSGRSVEEIEVIDALFTVNLSEFVIATTTEKTSYWPYVLGSIYMLGIVIILVKEVKEYVKIGLFFKRFKGKTETLESGVKLTIVENSNIAPFSWFNRIVISKADYQNNGEEIIAHETTHIKLGHSWDVLFANLIIMLQWFNPAAWLWKRELQLLHEYQVDDQVLKSGIDAQKYQLLLIQKSVGEHLFSLGNSFNHGYLKKRIFMMLNNKRKRWSLLKLTFILPLVVLLIALTGGTEGVFAQASSLQNVVENVIDGMIPESESEQVDPQQKGKKEEVFMVVEKMPEFPGGMRKMMEFLSYNIKYPEKAHAEGIQGRVMVKFIVNEEGKVVEPEVIKSINELLDEEALRVIKLMPNWIPGKQRGKEVSVYYTLPITFRLPGKAEENQKEPSDVLSIADKMPEFPGGMRKLMEYLANNVKYPVSAQEKNIQGRVIVTFIVEKDGSIVSPKVLYGIDPSLDSEAVRVISGMPKWTPGKNKGEAVSVKYTLPVTFRLSEKNIVYKQAEFPGGEYYKFVSKNIKYPEKARAEGIEANVMAQLVIDAEGNISSIEIQSPNEYLKEELARVIKLMPKWVPAEKEDGTKVESKFPIAVLFKFSDSTVQPAYPNSIICVAYR